VAARARVQRAQKAQRLAVFLLWCFAENFPVAEEIIVLARKIFRNKKIFR